MFSAALAAATLFVLPAFDAERVVRLLDEGEVTTALAVPAMLRSMLEVKAPPHRPGRSRFRRLTYGSAPMSPVLLRAAMDRFACDFQQGYGLTEASPTLTSLMPQDHVRFASDDSHGRLSSVGRETIGVTVRVSLADGSDARQARTVR